MKKDNKQVSVRTAAITSGIAILIMTIAATIANDVTIGKLTVTGDALATFDNIKSSEPLFRLGLYCWIVILICDLIVAWGLYVFFKTVSKDISLIAAWFRLIYVAVLGTAIANLVYVLPLVSGEHYLAPIDTTHLQTLTLFFVNAFNSMWYVGLIVFGFHVLLLGYLIFKSGFVPKIFGVLLMMAFVGYVVTNSSFILFPQFERYMVVLDWIFLLPMLGEVAFGIWLLVKGKNLQIQ